MNKKECYASLLLMWIDVHGEVKSLVGTEAMTERVLCALGLTD